LTLLWQKRWFALRVLAFPIQTVMPGFEVSVLPGRNRSASEALLRSGSLITACKNDIGPRRSRSALEAIGQATRAGASAQAPCYVCMLFPLPTHPACNPHLRKVSTSDHTSLARKWATRRFFGRGNMRNRSRTVAVLLLGSREPSRRRWTAEIIHRNSSRHRDDRSPSSTQDTDDGRHGRPPPPASRDIPPKVPARLERLTAEDAAVDRKLSIFHCC